jgi:cytidine deaminase
MHQEDDFDVSPCGQCRQRLANLIEALPETLPPVRSDENQLLS